MNGKRSILTETGKVCNVCGFDKPLSEFRASKSCSGGVHSQCKSCHCDQERFRTIGVTPREYIDMLDAQGGGCAICGTLVNTVQGKSLPVDHDHESGSIRGILCHSCNVGLGHFQDDPDKLMSAAAYLLARVNILGKVG